jgi:hypothetical protein
VERSHVSSPVVPAINRIVYDGLPDPKACAPSHTVATPSPVHDRRTTSLMQQLHGLQLNLTRAKQRSESKVTKLKEVIAEKDECIDVLKDSIKGKDDHIQVLNNHVRAIEAEVALLQVRNIFLSEEAENINKSDKQQENSSLYKRLDNHVGGRGK